MSVFDPTQFEEFFAEGSRVAIGTGATVETPGTYSDVGCVMSVTPPRPTMSFRDVRPCLSVTAPRRIKKKPTSIDYGTFEVSLRFDADFYDDAIAALEAGVTHPVACLIGDSGKAQVATCYIQSVGVPTLNEDGEVMIDVTFLVDDDFATVDAADIALFAS